MNQQLGRAMALLITALFVLSPVDEVARADDEVGLIRLVANKRGFTAGDEISVTARALAPDGTTPFANGGVVIYDKTFFVPEDINVLFITISATGDVHHGARMLIACLVDDKSCSPSKIPNGAPDGWVTVQRHKDYNLNYAPGAAPFVGDGLNGAGDLHDNSVYYTWCQRIKKDDDGAIHNVKIKMASQHVEDITDAQGEVSLEAVHFFIDGAHLRKKNACTVDTTTIPPVD